MQRQRGRVLQVSQEQTATQTGSADAVGALNVEAKKAEGWGPGGVSGSQSQNDGWFMRSSFTPGDGERELRRRVCPAAFPTPAFYRRKDALT